jgi:hypothetical protein
LLTIKRQKLHNIERSLFVQQISLPLGLPLKPKYAKRWQKNTMQLPKISNIIHSFILHIDVIVKTGGEAPRLYSRGLAPSP